MKRLLFQGENVDLNDESDDIVTNENLLGSESVEDYSISASNLETEGNPK